MRGNEPLSSGAVESLLQWWNDAGVDCLVDEASRDWLRPPSARARAENPVQDKAPARASAPLPGQLDLFQAYLASDDSLPFAAPGAPRICPTGDPSAGLMLLSDMPQASDCGAGTLLTGEPGALFDRMLAAIGRDRNSIYLASLSCLRPASGIFTDETAALCAELARHHVALVAPKALLLLGDACAKALLNLSVIQARGRWHSLATPGGDIPTLVSFHPAFLLGQPKAKRHAWADLLMLKEKLRS